VFFSGAPQEIHKKEIKEMAPKIFGFTPKKFGGNSWRRNLSTKLHQGSHPWFNDDNNKINKNEKKLE
jgi:hypothetical protein